jgi:4-hydroxy-2-oxoglutarate aldolase
MELRGIFAPITTPLSADGDALALDRLKTNFAVYNKTKLAGYVVCGSTGEAILLSWTETERLFAAVAEHAAPGKILVAGTGMESRVETIVRTRRAAGLGYKVALVRTPHYYKPLMTHTALLEFFRAVADASPIPILIYSIPQFTGVEVPGELVSRLAEHPNICGIKDSWGKLPVVKDILAVAPPPRFQTLVGSAAILEPSLKLGAVGAILGVACVLPELCAELYDAAVGGNKAKAEEIQTQLAPVAQKCVSELGVPGVKFAMDRLGMFGGPVRSPLLVLSVEAKTAVVSALATLQIPAVR